MIQDNLWVFSKPPSQITLSQLGLHQVYDFVNGIGYRHTGIGGQPALGWAGSLLLTLSFSPRLFRLHGPKSFLVFKLVEAAPDHYQFGGARGWFIGKL